MDYCNEAACFSVVKVHEVQDPALLQPDSRNPVEMLRSLHAQPVCKSDGIMRI